MKININKLNENIINLFIKISYFLATVFVFILCMFLTVGSVHIQLNEQVSLIFFNYYWLLFLILHICLIYLLLKFENIISEKLLFIFFSTLYIVLGLYIIYYISPDLRADAEIVYRNTILLRQSDFTFFTPGNYLNFYPHQHGLLYYDYILTMFSSTTKVLFFANLLEVICINFVIYKIVDLLGNNNKSKNLITIYLLFTFLQQLVFISFGYNLIHGFFFMIIGLYFILKYNQLKKYTYFAISIISFVLACLIRSNFIISVIAIFLYLWITNIKNHKFISLIFLITFLLTSKLFNFGMNSFTEKITGIEVNSGMPKLLWIAMGTDPDNWDFGPGWYNGYGRNVLSEVNYDYDKSAKIGKEKIIDNINRHISNPIDASIFFGAKFISTWADPTFESIWSGPKERYEQINDSDILNSLFNEGSIYWTMYHNMKSVSVLIFFSLLYYLLNKKHQKQYLIIFIVYLLGGITFHLIWETKSQYVYPYVVLLIPVVSDVIDCVYRRLKLKFNI